MNITAVICMDSWFQLLETFLTGRCAFALPLGILQMLLFTRSAMEKMTLSQS